MCFMNFEEGFNKILNSTTFLLDFLIEECFRCGSFTIVECCFFVVVF